jgi:REP element-mobilizing transposase RayT
MQKGMLPFRQPGGARPGAGRKPNGDQAGVPHEPRAPFASRFPAHVTVKLREGLPRLRQRAEYAALRAAFRAGCDRRGFRLVHYAVLNDHLHLIVEAPDRDRLTRGLQGLAIRVAKALNKLWQRHGKVFSDRYHDHVLKSPREVRNAVRYVLANAHRHAQRGGARPSQAMDVFTSGPWFDGWIESVHVRGLEGIERPVTPPRTWLLTIGWRRHGLISIRDVPAAS